MSPCPKSILEKTNLLKKIFGENGLSAVCPAGFHVRRYRVVALLFRGSFMNIWSLFYCALLGVIYWCFVVKTTTKHQEMTPSNAQ